MFLLYHRLYRLRNCDNLWFTQVNEGRGQNVTFDPLYFENFLELEHHRCLITQPCAVNTQAKKKSLTADSSPVDSVGKVFAG